MVNPQEIVKKLEKKVNYKSIVITLGPQGILVKNKRLNTLFKDVKLNAFELNPIDTIGAGDAVFGIASVLCSINTDSRVVAFLGNIFGALATKILGHSDYIKKNQVAKTIQYSLK